ncbi:MAG: hypothetical protein HQ541_19995, partial [Mariniphaga sp.]|nr:hypothetical protein [Mariniphaga sp.]
MKCDSFDKMFEDEQNKELNPSVSLIQSLAKILDYTDHLSAVLFYMPLHSNNLEVLRLFNRNYIATVIPASDLKSYPNREEDAGTISIQSIDKIKNVIYPKLSRRPEIFQENDNTGDMAVVLKFLSASDNKWDYLYILIDKGLLSKIFLHYQKISMNVDIKAKTDIIVNSYFHLVYPYLNEIVNSVRRKLDQLSKSNSYISRLFSYNDQLEAENAKLKQKKEAEILKEFDYLVKDAEENYKKKIVISEDTNNFILNYIGDLEHLKKSFIYAIEDLASLSIERTIKIKPIHIELGEHNKDES